MKNIGVRTGREEAVEREKRISRVTEMANKRERKEE